MKCWRNLFSQVRRRPTHAYDHIQATKLSYLLCTSATRFDEDFQFKLIWLVLYAILKNISIRPPIRRRPASCKRGSYRWKPRTIRRFLSDLLPYGRGGSVHGFSSGVHIYSLKIGMVGIFIWGTVFQSNGVDSHWVRGMCQIPTWGRCMHIIKYDLVTTKRKWKAKLEHPYHRKFAIISAIVKKSDVPALRIFNKLFTKALWKDELNVHNNFPVYLHCNL